MSALLLGEMGHVAPRVGAWIETIKYYDYGLMYESRPAWARGLKLKLLAKGICSLRRAPRGRVD